MAGLLSVMWPVMAHEQATDVAKDVQWVRNVFTIAIAP
jgi:hypothetical protein